MTADALQLLLVNGCFLVAGLGVTGYARWWRGGRGALASLGISYLAGVAAYGVLAQLLYVLGAPLVRWQVLAVCGVLATGIPFALGGPPRIPKRVRLPLPIVAGIGAMLALLALDLWFQPQWTYDAWTFWTPRAKALVDLGGLDAAWFTQSHVLTQDYPVLLPAVEAAGFRFTGYELPLLDLQSWLFLVGFVAAIVEVASARSRAIVLWAILGLLVFAPAVTNGLVTSEADIPIGAFFGCAGLCAYLWLEERDASALALAAVFEAGAAATKVEGLMFVLALTVSLAFVEWRRRRAGALLPVLAGVSALAVGLLPWRIWMHAHGVTSETPLGRVLSISALVHHGGRLPHIVAYMGVRLLDPRLWLVLVPFCALITLLVLRRADRGAAGFVLATVVLSLLGLVLAYWSTPLDLQVHLATSARRVVTGPIFFWAALTPMLASRIAPARVGMRAQRRNTGEQEREEVHRVQDECV